MADTPNQPDSPWRRDAFKVVKQGDRFGATGQYGEVIAWYHTRELAQRRADAARLIAEQTESMGSPDDDEDESDSPAGRPSRKRPKAVATPPPAAPAAPIAAPVPPPAAPPFSPPPPTPPIPSGYTYIPAHVRRVSRDIPEIGEETRSQFRGFPGNPAGAAMFGPNFVQDLISAIGQATAHAASNVAPPPIQPITGAPAPLPASSPPSPWPVGMQAAANASVPAPFTPPASVPVPVPTTNIPSSIFPTNMQAAARSNPHATTVVAGPIPNVPASIFPTSMLQAAGIVPPPAVPPPPPAPTAWQVFQQGFHRSLGPAVAMSGFPGFGRAAMAGFTAAIPGVGEVSLFAGAVVKATEQLRSFADQTLAANRALAPLSPMAMRGFFQLNLHDYQRQIDLAQRTEKSSSDLIKAVDAMRSSFQEYRVAALNLQNFGAGAAAGFMESAAKSFDWIPAGINAFFGDQNGQNGARNLGNFAWDVVKWSTTIGPMEAMVRWLQDKGLWPKAQQGPRDLRGPMDKFADAMAKGQLGGPLIARPRRPHMARGT